MSLEYLPINDLDTRIKDKLAAESDERGASVNDIAVGILAAKFGVPFEPAGGPPRARARKAKTTMLRMPERLYWAIDAAGKSKKAVVESVLCEHYGLRYAPPVRTRRRRRTAAA